MYIVFDDSDLLAKHALLLFPVVPRQSLILVLLGECRSMLEEGGKLKIKP